MFPKSVQNCFKSVQAEQPPMLTLSALFFHCFFCASLPGDSDKRYRYSVLLMVARLAFRLLKKKKTCERKVQLFAGAKSTSKYTLIFGFKSPNLQFGAFYSS